MRSSVVVKMVIGFASLAILLLSTSLLSYLGLLDIRQSAQLVAFEKMPIQQTVADLNLRILRLSSITTNGFFEQDRNTLTSLGSAFDKETKKFEQNLKLLEQQIQGENKKLLLQIQASSERYIEVNQALFSTKHQVFSKTETINELVDKSLAHADEASALMQDLGYLELTSAQFETLIGMTTRIENKLGLMFSTIKELKNTQDIDKVNQSIDDIAYNVSNVKVDADYAIRLAQSLNDDDVNDIFAQFVTQYDNMAQTLASPQGLYVQKQEQLALITVSTEQRLAANLAVTEAIEGLSALGDVVNGDALRGQEDILESVQANVLKNVIVSILGIIATVALAVLATRIISRPLKYVNDKISRVSHGDLTERLDETGDIEFSALAMNINHLITSLHSLITSIKQKELKLRELMIQSVEMGDLSLNHVAKQQDEIDATSQNTRRVRETSKSNLLQIQQADGRLNSALQQSEAVMALVERSKLQVNEQSSQAHKSTEIVNRLGETSHKIGSILDVIKTIAEQTNLLALNAAIEAARAGEQGRGFAVVADEVRTLATRTHDSTEEIEQMIARLQKDASEAVRAMEHGRNQVQAGVEITSEVTEQVLAIKEIINHLVDVNKQIVGDTKQQDTLLMETSSRLDIIVKLSKDSAGSTEASNHATHQIDDQVNELSEAIKQFRLV